MANYQYGTSPRKLEPEYQKTKVKKKKVQQRPKPKTTNKKKTKTKKEKKLSFEFKFFVNSMLFFSIIFAIIACQTLVEQKYKEKESLKQEYNELLASNNMSSDVDEDIRVLANEYGMQTKSATLIDLEISDYIESASSEDQKVDEGIFSKIIDWIKNIF